ncbi:MAG: radical SAM protein [Desulfobacterales bacterium]|nr:radical SAM protein [Desulfobacterales bacterium]
MKLSELSFESGPIRPPSEGGSQSLLLRTTRNCPWNKCRFCYGVVFNRKKFERRTTEEIKQDIHTIKIFVDEIRSVSLQLGCAGNITREVLSEILKTDPGLQTNESFFMVLNWLFSGAGTVFLQDANSLVMSTKQLVEVLECLKEAFPGISRITSYARSKTIVKKSLSELRAINHAGLTRLHVGFETGDDVLLKDVNKGVTSREHAQAGKKAKDAGFELSEYVMIDLGGRARFREHAENTARVLNEINPDFIRLRPLRIRLDVPLFEDYQNGSFQLSTPHERLQEVKILVENLNVTGRLCFDHFMNGWYQDGSRTQTLFKQDYDGYKFPEEKAEVLDLIDLGLTLDESIHLHYKETLGLKNL